MVNTFAEVELFVAVGTWLGINGCSVEYRIMANHPAFNASLDDIEWRGVLPVMPTEQNLIDAYNAHLAALTSKQQETATDTSERATLLQQAATALTQIESDKAALTAAASLAAVKPIVTNMLNREERIIKALRAIIRSGLDDS
jgi:hypothetical protein